MHTAVYCIKTQQKVFQLVLVLQVGLRLFVGNWQQIWISLIYSNGVVLARGNPPIPPDLPGAPCIVAGVTVHGPPVSCRCGGNVSFSAWDAGRMLEEETPPPTPSHWLALEGFSLLASYWW